MVSEIFIQSWTCSFRRLNSHKTTHQFPQGYGLTSLISCCLPRFILCSIPCFILLEGPQMFRNSFERLENMSTPQQIKQKNVSTYPPALKHPAWRMKRRKSNKDKKVLVRILLLHCREMNHQL